MISEDAQRRSRAMTSEARKAAGKVAPARRGQIAPADLLGTDVMAMLSGAAVFGEISDATKSALVAGSRVTRVAAGRVIFRKGDAPDSRCYLILKGAVKVSLPGNDAQETLLAVLGKGDMFGEMALLDQLPRSATVTALKNCELCQLTTATLERLATQDTAILRQLLRVLSARLRAGNETGQLQQMPLKTRLARALLRLAQGFGETLPDGRILIRQKLSQAELGRMVGAARENINRQLADWNRAKVLTRISAYYCIESPQTLERLADRDTTS